MKPITKILLLIFVNIIVSVGATLATLYFWEKTHSETTLELITSEEGIGETPTITSIPVTETPEAEITEEPDMEATEFVPAIRGAHIEIAVIRNPGVLESEALRIVNSGEDVVNLNGWVLEDASGQKYTFPNVQLLRNGIFIEVYSRAGHDTPYELFLSREKAVWHSGETAVIMDELGQIQATYRVP